MRLIRYALVFVAVALMTGPVLPDEPPARRVGPAASGPTSWPAAPSGARFVEDGWFAPVRRSRAPELASPVQRAYVIPIHGPISDTTYDVVKRKIIRCRASGAQLIIFDMDTPGGSGTAMIDLVDLIQTDLKDIYTLAYVNPEAVSAGAIISLACDEIVMSPTAVLGDAMPIMLGPGGQIAPIPEKERGKIESYMTSKVRTLAERNGYNTAMCEAMVTITIEIWLVRNDQTGELRAVDAREWKTKVSGGPGEAEADETQWRYVRTVVGPKKLVTMTAKEAVFYGFATRIVEGMDQLKRLYEIVSEPVVLRDNWSEKLVAFLTSPVVTSVLLMGALFFAYVEMHSPGFGVAGAIAVACFALLIGGRYLVGLANWWEIAVLVIGVALILLEVFVIPGFGVPGIIGIICIVVAFLAMILPNAPTELPIPKTDLDWQMLRRGIFALGVGFVAALVLAAVASRYLPKFPIASKLVLAPAEPMTAPPASPEHPIHRIQVGDVGIVQGPCRPVGKVRFGDDLIDAVSEGEMIPAGTTVRVLRREGNRLVVERLA